uniref:Coiled-coil domain containing 125 n=1 Tax=Cynoglossus semilaevis TaxID=244447 RepID=A0A3P8VIG7_CYNSE
MSVEENQTPGTSVVPVKVSKQPQMQGLSLEDDMVDGDLGDGTELRKTHSSSSRKTQSLGGLTEGTLSQTKLGCCNSEEAMAWISKSQQKASWKIPHCGSLNDLSKDELKDRLRQASEAILDKATTHTKSLLLKSDERAKALEKEVNSLQWELSFSQLQMKKAEQSWEQKYNGLLTENKTLINSLQERESEFQELRAENSALGRQCLELLSMLNLREQRVYEGSKPQYSPERNTSVLELAVLGACRCPGVVESCPCSRAAAASRKRLIKLQQELEAQRYRREEALMVADAFRIAFEQQLRKRN